MTSATENSQARSRPRQRQQLLAVALLALGALLSVATSSSPPAIDATNPSLGASSVDPNQAFEVSFERPVDPSSITDSSARLRREADGAVIPARIELTEGNQRLRLLPDSPLQNSTDYALELELDTITSSDGDTYVGLRYDSTLTEVWETEGLLRIPFTTRSELTVARAFRGEEQELLVYFSEAIDPQTLTPETIQLFDGDQVVPVDFRYHAPEQRLRLLVLRPLDPTVSYRVRLDGAITTPKGETLKGGAGEDLILDGETERLR